MTCGLAYPIGSVESQTPDGYSLACFPVSSEQVEPASCASPQHDAFSRAATRSRRAPQEQTR